MAFIILIGPSKVGKTTLSSKVSSQVKATHVDMDIEVNVASPRYMERAKQKIEDVNKIVSKLYILDFGAGFQNDPEAFNLFNPNKDKMITIMASPEVVYRNHVGRNWIEFLNTEYKTERQKIYNLSKYKLDISDDIGRDGSLLVDLIKSMQ